MKKYFKVKIGYGADDFISIDETELERAVKAQITGRVAVFNEGTASGNLILSITPDWNRVMGWRRDYKLTGEDYVAIGKERIEEYRLLQEREVLRVYGKVEQNPLISDGAKQLAEKFTKQKK